VATSTTNHLPKMFCDCFVCFMLHVTVSTTLSKNFYTETFTVVLKHVSMIVRKLLKVGGVNLNTAKMFFIATNLMPFSRVVD